MNVVQTSQGISAGGPTQQTMIVPRVANLGPGQNSAREKTDQSWAGTECEDCEALEMEVWMMMMMMMIQIIYIQ